MDSRPTARILSICDDDGLRLSREPLLLNDGYVVESIASSVPLSVARVRTFDIALICRSVDAHRAMALKEMLERYNSQIQVVCISPLDFESFIDASSLVPPTPEGLLHAIRLLADRRKASADVAHNIIGRAR